MAEQTYGAERVVLKLSTIIVRGDRNILKQGLKHVEPPRFLAGPEVIVEHNDFSVRPMKVVLTDSRPYVIRYSNTALLPDRVVDGLDAGCRGVAVTIADDEMFLIQVLGEFKASAKKVLSRHVVPK